MEKAVRWTSMVHSNGTTETEHSWHVSRWITWKKKWKNPCIHVSADILIQQTKMLSLTTSLGHSQPSHCLFYTQLWKQTGIRYPRATVFFEQQDLSSILLLFIGKIDHENKADVKENSNANLENTVKISSSPLFRPMGCGQPRMCPPSAELQEHHCEQIAMAVGADVSFWDHIKL